MFAQMISGLDFHANALTLRADRQRIIASNIANADTPGYVARDLNFKQALSQMSGISGSELPKLQLQHSTGSSAAASNPAHLALSGLHTSELTGSELGYAVQTQPSVDGNSVDLDRERASFVDNSVRYESTLRFINGYSKTILSAIQGQ